MPDPVARPGMGGWPVDRPVIAAGTGFGITISLAVLWHLLGLASDQSEAGYALSRYLTASISWGSGAVYFAAAMALGWFSAPKVPVALGMMSPLALAMAIELVSDPTSHNLFPLEIILFWGPAFLLAYLGAAIGTAIRTVR